jgi:hypothetical protein
MTRWQYRADWADHLHGARDFGDDTGLVETIVSLDALRQSGVDCCSSRDE